MATVCSRNPGPATGAVLLTPVRVEEGTIVGDAPLTVGSWALGRRLAHFRDAVDLKGVQVAKALGVSQPTVTRIEKGKHRLTPAQFKKLCRLYRISPEE